jgi:hypothetical protein
VWERAADRWVVHEGHGSGAAARVSVAPSATVAFLSRGVAPADAADALTISGDAALARGAIQIVAPLLAPPA